MYRAYVLMGGMPEAVLAYAFGLLSLAAQENRDAFKVYQADMGLLTARMGVRPAMLFDEHARKEIDAGALPKTTSPRRSARMGSVCGSG